MPFKIFLLTIVFSVECTLYAALPMGEVFSDYVVSDMPAAVHYFSTQPVEKGGAAKTAVVIVHGWGDGVDLPAEAPTFHRAAMLRLSGQGPMPYIVAPVFPTRRTLAKFKCRDDGRARWNDSQGKDDFVSPSDDWRGGGDANNSTFSSFDVIDRIFALLADRTRYPNLKRVVLTGFSAGGQFTGRYVAVGKGVVRDGVAIDYAPMAPSTWLRLDDGITWLYGLKDRPRYSASLSSAAVLENLSSRRQWNACGKKDVLKRPYTALDATAEAQSQGENRYDRFLKFRDYVSTFPDWAACASFHSFESIGHEYKKAFADKDLVEFLLFGRQ